MSVGLAVQAKAAAIGVVKMHAVEMAKAAADSVNGLVIADESTSIAVADLVGTARDGRLKLEAAKKDLCAPHRAALAEVANVLDPVINLLVAAEKRGKDSQQRWIQDSKRRAQAALDEQRRQAAKDAAEAAEQSIAVGEDVPPPPEVPTPLPAPAIVRGGSATMYQTTRLTSEMFNHHDADPTWLEWRRLPAETSFRDQIDRQTLEEMRANPGTVVEWRGGRFWFAASMGTK